MGQMDERLQEDLSFAHFWSVPVDLCKTVNARVEVLPENLCAPAISEKICAAALQPDSQVDPNGSRCRAVTMRRGRVEAPCVSGSHEGRP